MIEASQIASDGWGVSNVKNLRLQALIRYWHEKRGLGTMPSRGDIDPLQIPRLLPIVLIAEILGGEVRIRLLGSETTAAYGVEMRGRFIADFDLGIFTQAWRDAFAAVAGSIAISCATGGFTRQTRQCHAELALMPLSDDGQSITHIFGGLIIKPIIRNSVIAPPKPASYILRAPRGDDGEFQSRAYRPSLA